MSITWTLNEPVSSSLFTPSRIARPEIAEEVLRFHQSLPDYSPTPLVGLPALAERLGVNHLMVKDESRRFGLNAFKALGASYAMARVLADRLSLDRHSLTFEAIAAQRSRVDDIPFVTATDGNHGRAVAWAASQFGCRAVVYMPKGSSPVRLEAIRSLGAEASIIEGNYDQAVRRAEKAALEHGWTLLQDTSWPGYEQVPKHIMQGYLTMLTEILDQAGDTWPTHVFAQAGVGSFAAAMLAFLSTCSGNRPKPVFVVVEPSGAACFYHSMEVGNGQPHRVRGALSTIMAGLSCGEPSLLAWRVLTQAADAFVACSDELAKLGMRILGNPCGNDPRIVSGESGAVTTGLVFELLSKSRYSDLPGMLGLGRESNVLLFSTEGDTDPDFYREVIWGCG